MVFAYIFRSAPPCLAAEAAGYRVPIPPARAGAGHTAFMTQTPLVVPTCSAYSVWLTTRIAILNQV